MSNKWPFEYIERTYAFYVAFACFLFCFLLIRFDLIDGMLINIINKEFPIGYSKSESNECFTRFLSFGFGNHELFSTRLKKNSNPEL